MDYKELIKTIILTLLIVTSIILSSIILFSKELWSDDYNSFNYEDEQKENILTRILLFFKKDSKAKALDYSSIFYPKHFLLNKQGKVVLVSPNSNSYGFFNDCFKTLFNGIFENASFHEIDEDELKKAYKSPSVFIDFYNPISFNMLGDYYGETISSNIMEVNHIKHILLSLENDKSTATIYAKNDFTGKIFKISFNGDITDINEKIDELIKNVNPADKSYSYAFENSFDRPAEDNQGSLKLLLDSYMIININANSFYNIKPVFISDFNEDIDLYSKITQIFKVNINSARRFTDSNGAVNFVENFGTLKFHKDGLLEFNAVSKEKGIELKGDLTSDYEIVKKAGEFTELVNSIYPTIENNRYVFNKIIRDADNPDKYTVSFDIMYNGVPVIFKRPISDSNFVNNAITIIVEDGRIVSYTHFLLGFEKGQNSITSPAMIYALDEFYSVYDIKSNKDLTIKDMYNIYYYEPLLNNLSVKWAVSLSNDEIVIVSPKPAT